MVEEDENEYSENWWYKKSFCCCCRIRTGTMFIIITDLIGYCICIVQTIFSLGTKGGVGGPFPHKIGKYLQILVLFFFLILGICSITFLKSGKTRFSISKIWKPRTCCIIALIILYSISIYFTGRLADHWAAYLLVFIGVIIYTLINVYFTMTLLSFVVREEEDDVKVTVLVNPKQMRKARKEANTSGKPASVKGRVARM